MPRNSNSNTAIEKRPNNTETVNIPQQAESDPRPAPAQAEAYYTPLVDIIENDDAFVFQADLPGATADTVDVSFHDGTLTIEAKVAPRHPQGQKASYLWREYGVGHFYRSFNIETPVDADGIKAQYRNGVLELSVPKAETAKSRRIEVRSA